MEITPMIRRLLVPFLGSGLLLAATAGSAFAKCEGPEPKPEFCSEVIASLNGSGAGLQLGTPQTLVITVSQGEQPFEAMGVVLSFVSQQDGSRINVPATATGQPGLWRAVVDLPDEGIWITSAQVVTNTGAAYRIDVERLSVSLPPAPPVTAPPVAPTPPILPIALILAGLAAAVLGAQTVRSRRRVAAPEPAGSAAAADRA
jgi:hypothetical protein